MSKDGKVTKIISNDFKDEMVKKLQTLDHKEIPTKTLWYDLEHPDTGELVQVSIRPIVEDGKLVDLVIDEIKNKDVISMVTNSMWKNMRRMCKRGLTPSVINKDDVEQMVEYRKGSLFETNTGRIIHCPRSMKRKHGHDISSKMVPSSDTGDLIQTFTDEGMSWDDALTKSWEITSSMKEQTEKEMS